METLKKIVRNQYFPAAAVLIAVLLFWAIGLVGGLSMLNDDNPPIATLTWMLFVYMAAVLTPLAGVMAAVDLVRRWRRNRRHEQAWLPHGEAAQDAPVQDSSVQGDVVRDNHVTDNPVTDNPAQVEAVQEEPVQEAPVQEKPALNRPGQSKPAPNKPAQSKPALNRPAQSRPVRKKAA
jgi:hypothetical protein